MLWLTWLQHINRPARSVQYYNLTEYRCEVTASTFSFRPVIESSGGPFPSIISQPPSIDPLFSLLFHSFLYQTSYSYLRGRQRTGDSFAVAIIHRQRRKRFQSFEPREERGCSLAMRFLSLDRLNLKRTDRRQFAYISEMTERILMRFSWACKGINHYELLPPGKSINSDQYCQKLMRLKQEIEKKRSELINRRMWFFTIFNPSDHTHL
ncbi:hypothetical protein EVAR_85611_1 [Eumeta japonica]|uniref:Uncharacterized protein n=1 Tax=Eumeta variegata TaxID=151549 RepID=A0A4C1XQU9_EUMVA|nr:hypothetical protein EVAR_85611_1 [Eumeta japonica]